MVIFNSYVSLPEGNTTGIPLLFPLLFLSLKKHRPPSEVERILREVPPPASTTVQDFMAQALQDVMGHDGQVDRCF